MADTRLPAAPAGLDARGAKLWAETVKTHPGLVENELVLLHEACRMADRLDKLDALLRGEVEVWAKFRLPKTPDGDVTLVIDNAEANARNTANVMKQLLVSLRLPDTETAARPKHHNGSAPSAPDSATALERMRARKIA